MKTTSLSQRYVEIQRWREYGWSITYKRILHALVIEVMTYSKNPHGHYFAIFTVIAVIFLDQCSFTTSTQSMRYHYIKIALWLHDKQISIAINLFFLYMICCYTGKQQVYNACISSILQEHIIHLQILHTFVHNLALHSWFQIKKTLSFQLNNYHARNL